MSQQVPSQAITVVIKTYTLDAMLPFAFVFLFLSWCYGCFCSVSLPCVDCPVAIGLAKLQPSFVFPMLKRFPSLLYPRITSLNLSNFPWAQVTKAVYNILEIIPLLPFMMSTAKSVAEYRPVLSNCDFFNVCCKNLAILLPCKYLYSPNFWAHKRMKSDLSDMTYFSWNAVDWN